MFTICIWYHQGQSYPSAVSNQENCTGSSTAVDEAPANTLLSALQNRNRISDLASSTTSGYILKVVLFQL